MPSKAETWLRDTLSYEFENPDLFLRALSHRSAAGASNERLEFLGDAVLELVVSEFIFRSHADAPEGDLSRLRSSLVKDTSLAAIAADLGLGEHLLLGGGERKAGGHRRKSILADGLEAIFGAVYLDGGFEASRTVIERAFGERLTDLPSVDELRDPKTRLQEWLQARGLGLPVYELVTVTGAAHRRHFEVSCSVDHEVASTSGIGTTRRNAEQDAAQYMLEQLLPERVK